MNLYENFNTTNQTSPSFARHENFVIDLKSPGCAIVQTMQHRDRCDFVKETYECSENVHILDYTYFYYCVLNAQNMGMEIFGVILLFLACFYLSAFVGTTTDKFFCPPLKIITEKLGLSESVAGVTLLAFGNSIPDLLSCLVGISGEAELGTLYSDLMGSAMFITACISGSIVYMKPFHAEHGTFARDLSFHILAIVFIDYAIKSDNYVTIMESVCMLSIYISYFTIVILDQVILVHTLKSLKAASKQDDGANEELLRRIEHLQIEAGHEVEVLMKEIPVPGGQPTKKSDELYETPNEKLFFQFKTSLMPLDVDEWNEGGIVSKLCIVLQVPINVLLYTLLPIVDIQEERNGWSKLLNCLQIALMPAALSGITASMYSVFNIPLPLFTLFLTAPIGVVIFCITRTDSPPKFHFFFAMFTIVGATVSIRIFALEVINIIDVLGIVTYSSKSFLGCTILAWGNCVGDLIASIALAQLGYQRMAFASCVAGPLFYLTLGLGITYLFKSVNSESSVFAATQGSMGENCTIFLLVNLIGLLIATATTNFNVRRSVAMYLLITYGLFCLYCLLGEYQFIHPFGTDHTEDYGIAYL